MSPLRKTVTSTSTSVRGKSTNGNFRTSPIAFTVSIALVREYESKMQVGIEDVDGIEDGCSEGIEERGVCEATCKIEELPKRARRILAAHETLIVTDRP
jgi:hypothetical protein